MFINLTNDWEIAKDGNEYETRGYSPDKTWFQSKTNPDKTALFKPDSHINNSNCETKASKTAESLGLNCAKTELVNYNGVQGVLSHNFKKPDKTYIPAEQYIFNSIPPLLRVGQVYDSSKSYSRWMSMETVRQFTPEIETQIVDMLVYDCLIQNRDRHGKNFEIELDFTGQTANIALLFDHGMSFGWSEEVYELNRNEYNDEEWQLLKDGFQTEEILDHNSFTWEREKKISHLEMFANLSADYPKQVNQILERAANVPDLDDFCKNRLFIMQDIYEYNKDKKHAKTRESLIASQIPLPNSLDANTLTADNIAKSHKTSASENQPDYAARFAKSPEKSSSEFLETVFKPQTAADDFEPGK
jgi:hypothetical protein